jgi:hypothetical protein
MNLVTPKAAAKSELLFNKLASVSLHADPNAGLFCALHVLLLEFWQNFNFNLFQIPE